MHTVLVVDDEPIIRNGIKKIVERYPGEKLNIHCASNGIEALAILSEQSVQIVLTDIRMPKMDGIALCEHIDKQYPYVMSVVISGYDDFSYAKQAISYGVREYLLKPVFPPDLYSVLDKFRREWNKDTPMVSLSMYENWMEEIEEKMWKLDMEHIPQLLQQWENHCKELDLRSDQLAQLLKDCLENIRKRMLKRSFSAQVRLPAQLATLPNEAMLEQFKSQITEVTDQLATLRGAKFRDPFEETRIYIDTHLSEDISLEEIAQRVGISPTYFSHLFKREMNETFVHYRTRKRMEYAEKLMEIPHYRIIDICQAVGFSDYPHFTKTFKRFFGYSPSEYRKKMGIDK